MAFRRGWILVVLVFIVPLPQPAEAALWDDLWLNKNQQAQKQLRDGNAMDAAELFDDPEWQAVARYRAEDFAGSADQFAEHGDSRNLYNLGNALAFQGELDGAIDAYQQALAINPDDVDAQYNLELVESLKTQQEQEQQNQGDEQQSTENPGGEGEQSDAESDPDQQGSEGNSQSQSDAQDGDSPQRDDDEQNAADLEAMQQELQRAAEQAEAGEQPQQPTEAELAELREQQEQQQAMEQWLRRVPDDPGGLLRRKFRYQYQRSGKDQDGNDVWPDDEVQPW
jgi:Ca-activated chloride channel family protein